MVAVSSKDRLAELRHLASGAGVYHDTVLEAPVTELDGKWKDLDELFREVEQIRDWIHDLNLTTQLMRRLHADPTYHTNKHLQEQLDTAVTRWGGAALKASGALRQLEQRARSEAGAAGAARRIARLQSATLHRRYADALADHQRALQLVRDDQLRLLHDQMRLTNLDISEEECERLLDSNNIALFVDNVRAETAEARRALRDAEVRRDELARVELALRDVHELFQHLAHLVAAQQDQIDSVEYFALQATEHVECGGQELFKGTVSRRKAKKKKIGLVICLVCGFLIVLLVLIIT
ncbi:syntaxin-like [Epargyreus clarus]|uniref:syntaxin-like n=1 Tax=Epargyreus clarus TaxID=520877 RepID=UPI003C2DA5EA